jgi:UTP--glucose-1-phosphate uridylyltransferase
VIDGLDLQTAETLERFGFEPDLFETLRARVASGDLSAKSNVVQGVIEPPLAEDLTRLPDPGDAAYDEAHAAGVDALRPSEVAQIVLAGGMATRFGGVVKAALPAVDGRSFLEVKLSQTQALEKHLNVEIPVALMTSFATDDVIRAHVAERGLGDPLVFNQFVSLRLETNGELFRDDAGRPSLYAPGHGDLFQALRRSAYSLHSASAASASSRCRTSTTWVLVWSPR